MVARSWVAMLVGERVHAVWRGRRRSGTLMLRCRCMVLRRWRMVLLHWLERGLVGLVGGLVGLLLRRVVLRLLQYGRVLACHRPVSHILIIVRVVSIVRHWGIHRLWRWWS